MASIFDSCRYYARKASLKGLLTSRLIHPMLTASRLWSIIASRACGPRSVACVLQHPPASNLVSGWYDKRIGPPQPWPWRGRLSSVPQEEEWQVMQLWK